MSAALLRDINALPDDVDEELKEVLLKLANNDPSFTNAMLRFKLEICGACPHAHQQLVPRCSACVFMSAWPHSLGDLEIMLLARALEANTVVKDLSLASNKLSGKPLSRRAVILILSQTPSWPSSAMRSRRRSQSLRSTCASTTSQTPAPHRS